MTPEHQRETFILENFRMSKFDDFIMYSFRKRITFSTVDMNLLDYGHMHFFDEGGMVLHRGTGDLIVPGTIWMYT